MDNGEIMLKEMKAYAHLKPGQDGTKRLVDQYGDKLLCVRYRYDEIRGVKLKTVEIIVDEKPLQTPGSRMTTWCRCMWPMAKRSCGSSCGPWGRGGMQRGNSGCAVRTDPRNAAC